jgi:hypothetical protein
MDSELEFCTRRNEQQRMIQEIGTGFHPAHSNKVAFHLYGSGSDFVFILFSVFSYLLATSVSD